MTKPTSFEQNLQRDLLALEETTGAPEIFRLAQARRSALAQEKSSESSFFWPAFGISAASVLLAGVMLQGQLGLNYQQEASNNEVLLEFEDDQLDLYQDLDFYYWLADIDMDSAS
jgi:hypothetical protein